MKIPEKQGPGKIYALHYQFLTPKNWLYLNPIYYESKIKGCRVSICFYKLGLVMLSKLLQFMW